MIKDRLPIGEIHAGSVVQFGGMVNGVCFLHVGDVPVKESEIGGWDTGGYDLCALSEDFPGPRTIQIRGLAVFMNDLLVATRGLQLESEEMYDAEGKRLEGIELAKFRDVDEIRYVVRSAFETVVMKFRDVPEKRRFLVTLIDKPEEGLKEVECVKIKFPSILLSCHCGVRQDRERLGTLVLLGPDDMVKLILDREP